MNNELTKVQLFKLERGEWLGTFPTGYKVETQKKRTKYSQQGRVFIDEEKATYIRELFSLYSKGNYSIKKLVSYLKKKYGWSLANSAVERVLKNPFYCGEMEYKGKVFPHKYPILISKELFSKVQLIRFLNNSKSSTFIELKKNKELLKKLIFFLEENLVSEEKKTESYILILLENGPLSIEEIQQKTARPFQDIQQEMIDLELEDHVEEVGGRWKKKKNN